MNRREIVSLVALLLSIVFFVLGIIFPLFSTHKQFIFRFDHEEVNLFTSIRMFYSSREYLLGTLILLFSFVTPLVEFVSIGVRLLRRKVPVWLNYLDKWNMLDVFVVALLLLNFKMQSNIFVLEIEIGTTFIALSVIMRIIAVMALDWKSKDIVLK